MLDLEKLLFAGSETSLLHVIESLLEVQQRHKLSETCMIDLFDVVSAILPKDNAMIQYAAAKREVSGCVHEPDDRTKLSWVLKCGRA